MLYHILSLHSLFIRFVCSHTRSLVGWFIGWFVDCIVWTFLMLAYLYKIGVCYVYCKDSHPPAMLIHQRKCCIRTNTTHAIFYFLISTTVLAAICLMLSTFNPSLSLSHSFQRIRTQAHTINFVCDQLQCILYIRSNSYVECSMW